MKKKPEEIVTIMQFQREIGLPIFIKIIGENFSPDIFNLLKLMQFDKIKEDDAQKILLEGMKQKNARTLEISECGPLVVRQLGTWREMPLDGSMHTWGGMETVFGRDNYKVYRYQGLAMIVFSHLLPLWKMGTLPNFGASSNELAARSVLARFLSWALAPHGIVGFWGAPVEEGVVVMRQWESGAESFFVDTQKSRIISIEGIKKLNSGFKIHRLDRTLKNRQVRMTSEQILAFLSNSTTYLSTEGLTVPIRQMIRQLSMMAEGIVLPFEDFKPRADLSL